MSKLEADVKLIKAAELFNLTHDILEQGGRVWITVTGMSMFPFLAENRDSVELSKTTFSQIKRGDIVLIQRKDSAAYVLHRVLRVHDDCFYMIGDAQQWIEGPLMPDQLQAVVTRIKRKGKVIPCDNILLRFCVFLWLLLIPVRSKLFRLRKRFKRPAKA